MKKTVLGLALAGLVAVGVPLARAEVNQEWPYGLDRSERERQELERQRAFERDREYPARDWRRERRERERARVVESRPLYPAGQARQECWNERAGHFEELRESRETRVGKGAAIGAIAGGVLGHQVDHGTGTAAGAVIGGLIGHQVQRRNERDDQPDLDRSRCRVIAENGARPAGYDVRYEYQGREYVTRLDHDPGPTVRVGREIREDGTPFDSRR